MGEFIPDEQVLSAFYLSIDRKVKKLQLPMLTKIAFGVRPELVKNPSYGKPAAIQVTNEDVAKELGREVFEITDRMDVGNLLGAIQTLGIRASVNAGYTVYPIYKVDNDPSI